MQFTKQDTLILKGVAILFMLFLHLFNQMENVILCDTIVTIKDVPLIHILTRATNPVPFFLILGGYGMYSAYKKGDDHRFIRIIKLFVHYWVILLLFVCLGIFLFPNRYPGSWVDIISNITGFRTTYNGECWFLLPYILLSFSSPWLFGLSDKIKTRNVLAFLFFVNLCTSFLISRFGVKFFYHNYWAYNPLLYFHLMFAFYVGAMSAKHNIFGKIKLRCQCVKRYSWIFLLALIIFRCFFTTSAFHTIYAFGFLCLFIAAPRNLYVDKALAVLGKHSMNMWLIHSWFCYYLFHNFIYGLKYPLLIFIVLVLVSLLCSIIINSLCYPIEKIFNGYEKKP